MTDLERDAWGPAPGEHDVLEPTELEDRDLAARVDDLEALVAALSTQLNSQRDKETPALQFTTLPAFVDWFAQWYRRDADGAGFSWCAQWWEHPEAVLRLEAVWRAYEALRHDPATGISVWVRDHVDPHLGKLTADGGPFGTCRPDEHRNPLPPLPIADPPDDWWTEADSGL